MKNIFLLLSCVFLFSINAFAQEWPSFKSTDENFQISMPAEPEQQRTSGGPDLGYGNHIYSLDYNGILYTLSVSNFNPAPTEEEDIKHRLDVARDVVLGVTGGKLLTDEDLGLQGFPGRLIRVEKNKQVWTLRAFVVKQRMYQLMTTETKSKNANPAAAKFFDSFKLLRLPE